VNRGRVLTLAAASMFLFLVVPSRGQTSVQALPSSVPSANRDDDPKAIFELGAATGWEVNGGAATFAPNLAAEITPIDCWLELEAADFMFWPTGKHRFGWYLEPAYDYSFAGGHQKSIGISGGLLIGVF